MQIKNKKKIKTTIYFFDLAIMHLWGRRCAIREPPARLQPISKSQKLPKSWLQKSQGTETLIAHLGIRFYSSFNGCQEVQIAMIWLLTFSKPLWRHEAHQKWATKPGWGLSCIDDVMHDVTRACDVIARVASRSTSLWRQTDGRRSPEHAKLWIFKIVPILAEIRPISWKHVKDQWNSLGSGRSKMKQLDIVVSPPANIIGFRLTLSYVTFDPDPGNLLSEIWMIFQWQTDGQKAMHMSLPCNMRHRWVKKSQLRFCCV